jgi:hypothetical protein
VFRDGAPSPFEVKKSDLPDLAELGASLA